jgi:fumarate hydratase class I
MIPNCAATRHVHFELDGSGPAELTPPRLEDWPEITREAGGNVRRVNVDGITKAELASWKSGDTVLLSGKILTGRDAAHKRIADMLKNGEGLPEGVDFTNRSSITWARSMRCVTKWSARPAPPRPPGWTSSPT